jgi:4-amino-4-deoxy-L-arabinose transferase-like glycosyltransferase
MTYDRGQILGFILAIGVGALYFFTLREGHDWGGDFAQYIAHAKNIADGRDYADTEYLYNRGMAFIGPPTYPPVLPIILSPVQFFLDTDLHAMKAVLVALAAVAVYMVFSATRPYLGDRLALLSTVVIWLNPTMWELKESILSEIPFILFVYTSFVIFNRIDTTGGITIRQVMLACVAGIVVYLAYGTRSVGLLLLPALLGFDVIQHRKIRMTSLIVVATFALFYGVQVLTAHSDAGYADSLAAAPIRITSGWTPDNVFIYAKSFGYFFPMPFVYPLQVAIFLLVLVLGVIGFARQLFRHIGALEIFFTLYVLALIFLPFVQSPRYVTPIFPLIVFYLVLGIQAVLHRFRNIGRGVAAAIGVTVAITYGIGFASTTYGKMDYGVEKPESVALFTEIRQRLPANAIIIFQKPRVMALFGERRSAAIKFGSDFGVTWQRLRSIGATHLVIPKPSAGLQSPLHGEAESMAAFVLAQEDYLNRRFENADFSLYEITRYPAQ